MWHVDVKKRFVVTQNVPERHYTSYNTVKTPLICRHSFGTCSFFKLKKLSVLVTHTKSFMTPFTWLHLSGFPALFRVYIEKIGMRLLYIHVHIQRHIHPHHTPVSGPSVYVFASYLSRTRRHSLSSLSPPSLACCRGQWTLRYDPHQHCSGLTWVGQLCCTLTWHDVWIRWKQWQTVAHHDQANHRSDSGWQWVGRTGSLQAVGPGEGWV